MLTSRLDGLARGEASAIAEEPRRLARRDYLNPEVVLVARINDARLILPWEAGSQAVTSMPPESDSEFSRVLSPGRERRVRLEKLLPGRRALSEGRIFGASFRPRKATPGSQRARALVEN
ncbi:MAG: hypothetical protein MZV63_14195 [Marinilabiliales bacterium]|nr:hypothetical protein [Marinilabiliales bacterium]